MIISKTPPKLDIVKLENTLNDLYKIVKHQRNNNLSRENSSYELKKIEVYSLLLAARIDVSICFNHITGVTKYEGMFFLNIAFMKMDEIMKTMMKIYTQSNNPLFYRPHPESQKEIVKILNKWKNEYGKWIRSIRNHSTAHYEPNFLTYFDEGYCEINANRNYDCFMYFFKSLGAISDSIFKYDPIEMNKPD